MKIPPNSGRFALGFLLIVIAIVAVVTWPRSSARDASASSAVEAADNSPAAAAPDAARQAPPADGKSAPVVAVSPPFTARAGDSPIDQFAEWSKRYLAATVNARTALLAEGLRLAAARRPVLKQLIQDDPRRALESAVPMVVRQNLPAAVVDLLEERLSGIGGLEVLAVSPDSDPSEPIIRHVATLGEREWRAFVYGRRAEEMSLERTMMNGIGIENVMAIDESPVRPLEIGEIPDPAKTTVETCPVSGLTTTVAREPGAALPPVVPETPAIEAGDQIIFLCDGGHIRQFIAETLAAEGATGGPTSPTEALPITRRNSTGVRRFIYMRAVFPDRLDERRTEVEAYAACRQLDEYFQEISYGKLSFQGTVTPTIVLPRTEQWYKDDYDSGGGAGKIMTDAKEAAREMGYSPENYHHYVLIYSGGPGAFGGLGSVNGSNTWLRTDSVGTFRHEIGHNIGVWHSNFWNTAGESTIGPGRNQEYGHHNDVMGSSGSGGHFNASMKQILEWITPETYHVVRENGVYRIHQFDQVNQDPDLRYAIEVSKDPEREYWIEFRQKLNTIPWYQHGASMNWSRWGRNDGNSTLAGSNRGTQLLDMTPGSADDRNDSPLVIGRTFSDYEADVHITPIGVGGTTPESLDVQVNVGTAAGNTAPTLTIIPSATSIAAGGSVTLTANANDADGDTLAYHWSFGDKQASYNGPTFSTDNSAVQNKTFASAGWYAVQCTVSDMKGGAIRDTVLIEAGSPATFYVSGTVSDSLSAPLYDVRVHNGLSGASYRGAYTDSDGEYFITNLSVGNHTLSASTPGYTFAPSTFSNPVTVGPNQAGLDFTATETNHVSMEIVDGSATEGGGTAAFRLARTGNTAAAETVYVDLSGSAVTGDYSLVPAADASSASPLEVFTIPAGAANLDIVLTAVQDAAAEGPETLVVSLLNAGDTYLPVGAQTIALTIDDDDTALPRVTLGVADDEAVESATPEPAAFTVTRTGSTAAALLVKFTLDTAIRPDAVAPFAVNGIDYNSLGINLGVIIPVGASSNLITITPIDDSLTEGIELVKLDLSANAAYILGDRTSGTIKIIDDDIPNVTIVASDPAAAESGDTANFAITRSGDTSAPLTVNYSSGGDALHGTDYQALPGYVTMAPGQSTADVLIVPIDDDQGEPAQSVVLQLRSASHYRVGTPSSAAASIADNGDLPVVAVSAYDGVVEERASPDNGQFRLITTGTGAGNITVNYQVTGTATNGVDYTNLPGTRTMGVNTTSNVTVTVINDSDPEDAETIIFTILPGAGYQIDPAGSATIAIRDDDAVNMVSVSPNVTSLTEGGTGRFFFSRSGSTTNPLDLTYAMGGTAGAADYTPLSGAVTIAAGSIGAYVDVVTANDPDAEGFESIVVTVDPDTGAPRTYGLEVASATLTLLDNDSGFTNTLAFANVSASVGEGDGTVNIAVNRGGAGLASSSCSVEYAVRYSTAFGNGVDFNMETGRLEFAPGESEKSIPLELVDDHLTENVEAVILQLRNPTNAEIAANTARSTVFIGDNEPRITVEASDPFAYEPGDTAEFRVSRRGSTAGALAVPLAISGTAVSGVDFAALPSSVIIPDGAASTTLTLTPLANPAANAPLTVTLALAPSGASLPGGRGGATITIGDAQSDDPPFVHLVSPLGSSPGVPSNVTLRLEALAADDTPGSLTTTWTKLSGPGVVSFENASAPATGATFSAAGAYLLRLTANDGGQSATLDLSLTAGAPVLPWTLANIGATTYPGSAAEHHGHLALSASGANVSGSTDRVFFRHRELNGDGEIIARVRNLFQTNANARVGVMIRDSTAAASLMAAMHLSPAPSFSGSSNRSSYQRRTATNVASTDTPGATPSWWVRLTRTGDVFRAFDSPDGVNWTQRGEDAIASIGATALAGISVTSASTSELTLAEVDNIRIVGTPDNNGPLVDAGPGSNAIAGESHPLSGSITDDGLPGEPGVVEAAWSLVSGPGAAIFDDPGDPGTAVALSAPGVYTLRLVANDGEVATSDEVTVTAELPTITVAATGPAASEEGLSPGEFTISRNSTGGALTVHFSVTGTAAEGSDYAAIGASVVIADGSASAPVPVVPLADPTAEGSESVTLSLSADTAYTVGAPSSAGVTLLDLPCDDWRFHEFGPDANNPVVAALTANPDGDELSNLEEYAYGTNPNVSDIALITAETVTIGPDDFLRLTITRNPGATDLDYEVQATGDLSNPLGWSAAGLVIEVDTPAMLRVRDNIPAPPAGAPRCMRLVITK